MVKFVQDCLFGLAFGIGWIVANGVASLLASLLHGRV